MQGLIVSFRRELGIGVIRCQDGRNIRFLRSQIINPQSHFIGEEVDFDLLGRQPRNIIVLAGSPFAVFAGSREPGAISLTAQTQPLSALGWQHAA